MSRYLFVVNHAHEVKATQTTAMMMQHAAHSHGDTFVTGAGELGIGEDGLVRARVRRVVAAPGHDDAAIDKSLASMRAQTPESMSLAGCTRVFMRTSPGRDERTWLHGSTLEIMRYVEDAGVPVVNAPEGLARTASKAYLATLPQWVRPKTIVSCERDELVAFVRGSAQPSILKPVLGTRGDFVFRVGADEGNLNQILDVLLMRGQVVAQAFVPEAVNGDTRVLVLDGRVLESNGAVAAVQRVPHPKDFRSNIHAGGTAKPGVVSSGMRRVVDEVGPALAAHGVRLAGLDFLGDVLCEINVFSTGGLRDAEGYTGEPFCALVMAALTGEAV